MKEELALRRKQKREDNAQVKKKYEQALAEAIRDISLTEPGIFLLKHLRKECGFGSSNTVTNIQTGELILYSTVYNNAQENVYKALRRFIPKKAKILIELND